jgi:hypothetical protein
VIILKLLANGTYDIAQGQHRLAIVQEMANASGQMQKLIDQIFIEPEVLVEPGENS